MLQVTITTQLRLKELVDYQPESGIFTWLARPAAPAWDARYAGKRAGHVDRSGYCLITIDGHKHTAARLAWLYMTGAWPAETIDHKNCIRSDDRFENLRPASFSENLANRSAFGKSGLKGAYHNPDRGWFSCIRIGGRTIQLGRFRTAEEAHAAYVAASTRVHGEFSRTT